MYLRYLLLTQSVTYKMWCHIGVEVYHGNDTKYTAYQIYHIESKVFGNVTSAVDAESDTYIPGCEISAGGCAALIVWGQIDI